MDRLTLDTNVVRDLWRDDEQWREAVEQLLALAETGQVDLAVTRYINEDVPRGALTRRIGALGELRIHQTGGVVQLGRSTLNGEDGLGDQAVIDLERQLRAVALAIGAKTPGNTDWLHLHAHRIQRRDFFLTRDKAILQIADELADVGIVVITPGDYLALRDGV